MKLEEVFERVVVINLESRGDRRERLRSNMRDTGIADPDRVQWARAISGNLVIPPSWWGAGGGAWGCLMSHLRIAQDAIHDGIESYCVLEDDVVFHPRAPEILQRFMAEVPQDWGQIYLGGQFLVREPEVVSPWVMKPWNVNRTHAFAVSRQALPRFLQHIMHAPDYYDMARNEDGSMALTPNCFHIDHQLGRAHEREYWKTFAPRWWLCGQEGGSSNISGRNNPRLWWHWRSWGTQLPFFYLNSHSSPGQRAHARRYLHPGNNTVDETLVDIGIHRKLEDDELFDWLKLIAGEAIEQWRLPGFEVPEEHPDLPARVRGMWPSGLLPAEDAFMASAMDYPFNGFFDVSMESVSPGTSDRAKQPGSEVTR